MEPLPKIPSPPALVWRELRHLLFPPLIFAAALTTAVVLWRDHAAAPHLIGEVETISSLVTSGEDGLIVSLAVDRFADVRQGDVIAEIRTSDPDSVRVELATISSELQVLQTRIAQDQQRILQDFEQLRLSWLRERVDLATARVELQFAENELVRVGKLYADRLISEDQFDLAKSVAEARRAEVAERSRLVSETEASLGQLNPADASRFDASVSSSISEALAAQEEMLRQDKQSVTLRSPIDGIVSLVHRRAGERLREGDAVVTISATTAEHIVGYLPQPVTHQPQPGDMVEVRSRANRRQMGVARVIRVGSVMESVTNSGGFSTLATPATGLPLLISVPAELALLPGESVELALRRE